jgi:hypothetical protein
MNLQVYIRALVEARHGTPQQLAGRIRSLGLSGAYFLVCAQEGPKTKMINGTDPKRTLDYLQACREAKLQASVWGFPDPAAGVDRFADRMLAFRDYAHALCIDPEKPFKAKNQAWFTLAERMAAGMQGCAYPHHQLVLSSFGALHFHPSLPLSAADSHKFDLVQPQWYQQPAKGVMEGVMAWRKRGFKNFEPALPAWGPNAGAKLPDYAKHVYACIKNTGGVTMGGVLWSYEHLVKRSPEAAATRLAVEELVKW